MDSNRGAGRGRIKLHEMTEEDHIKRLVCDGRDIILVGTAHVSRASVDLVERVIRAERPDTVCVELCQSRYDAMRRENQWQEMDILEVVRGKRASLLLFQLIMASFQKRLALRLHTQPGEEMLRAIRLAEETGATVVLADREIRITLLRSWRKMGGLSKIRLLPELIFYLFLTDEISEEDMERLKQEDMLEAVLQTAGQRLPALKTVVIDERDRYMAGQISKAPGSKIVAVAGIGHIPGIARQIGQPVDLDALNHIPPRPFAERFAAWGLSALVLAIFAAGFFISGSDASLKMIGWWSAITAFFAALGALLLLSHPVTVLASALAAPVATLYPLFAAGWIAGFTEAYLRKPRVRDFLSLPDDIMSVRGFFRNKITRVLIIVAFVNLTTSIGTFVAIPVMMAYFK